MEDLFYREQKILDSAYEHLSCAKRGDSIGIDVFESLATEYGRLLKQLRRVTRISDKTTVDLNTSKLDLLDKVHYDALTGIYNRRFFEDGLKRIIKSLSRSGCGALGVLMIDIDFFKDYNDNYGHSMGDECLKAVAKALKNGLLREDDFVARYGGEEFAVVLPNTGKEKACSIAQRMLDNVRACDIPHIRNLAAPFVTISIGVTSSEKLRSLTGIDFIKRADEALYISKKNGKNMYTYLDMVDNASNT